MAKVSQQQGQLFVALLPNADRCIRIAPAESLRVVNLHRSLFVFWGTVERAKEFGRGPKRSLDTSLSDVVKTFRQSFLDERFRSEDQAMALEFHLQVIAGGEPQLVMKSLRNGDLTTGSDLDDGRSSVRLGLYFHIIIFYWNAEACQQEPHGCSILSPSGMFTVVRMTDRTQLMFEGQTLRGRAAPSPVPIFRFDSAEQPRSVPARHPH